MTSDRSGRSAHTILAFIEWQNYSVNLSKYEATYARVIEKNSKKTNSKITCLPCFIVLETIKNSVIIGCKRVKV